MEEDQTMRRNLRKRRCSEWDGEKEPVKQKRARAAIVHEEKEETSSIDRLPSELLLKIFGYLDNTSRKVSSVVCKRWNNLVFTRSLCEGFPLTFDQCLFRAGYEPMNTFTKSNGDRVFPYIQIGAIEDPKNKIDDLPAAKAIFQKIGHSTIKLSITDQKIPEGILAKFPQLQVLEVQQLDSLMTVPKLPDTVHTIVAKHAKNNVKRALYHHLRQFKNVKTIQCEKFSWSEFNMDSSSENQYLLQPEDELVKFKEANSISSNLKISSNLLSNKKLDFDDVVGIKLYDAIENYGNLQLFTNLQELQICVQWCVEFHQEVRIESLKRLKIGEELDEGQLCDLCFRNILDSFPNVEKLSLKFFITMNQAQQVFRKYPNLKSLTMDVSNLDSDVLAPSVPNQVPPQGQEIPSLASMPHLEKFKMIHQTRFDDDDDEFFNRGLMDWDLIANWPAMPRLKRLTINALEESEEYSIFERLTAMHHLINQCPNVQKFSIRAEEFDAPEIGSVIEGWPNLTSLAIELISDRIDLEAVKDNVVNLKQLRLLDLGSHGPAWDPFDKDWQFDLFEKMGTLQKIFLSKTCCMSFDEGLSRLAMYNKDKVKRILALKAKRSRINKLLKELGLPDTGSDSKNEAAIRTKQSEEWIRIYGIVFKLTLTDEEKANLTAQYVRRMKRESPI